MLIKEKVEQAKVILKEHDVDCWITFARESIINGDPMLDFLVGSHITWHSAFIITKEGRTWAIVGKYDRATVEALGVYDNVIDFVEGIKPHLQEVVKEIDPREIAVNFSKGSEVCDGLTYGMYLTLEEYLGEIGFGERFISAEKIISSLKGRKSKFELGNMSKAIVRTLDIYNRVTEQIKPGVSEKDLAAWILNEVDTNNLETAWSRAQCPSVFTGPDTASAHFAPTDRKVEKGHVLNMDFGLKIDGYCSDLQRTWYVLNDGETEAPADVQKGFDTIVEAVERARLALKPGVKGLEIDKIARDYIVSQGYDEFPFGLGHQVGRFAHDGTALLGPAWEKYAQKPFETIEEGMVFTIEPRLMVPGKGEVTIEEMVVVRDGGAQWLSEPQKEIILV